jgi:hypothetical protein
VLSSALKPVIDKAIELGLIITVDDEEEEESDFVISGFE